MASLDGLEPLERKAMPKSVTFTVPSRRTMIPDRNKRYSTADGMLADLEAFRKDPNINFEYSAEELRREFRAVLMAGLHNVENPLDGIHLLHVLHRLAHHEGHGVFGNLLLLEAVHDAVVQPGSAEPSRAGNDPQSPGDRPGDPRGPGADLHEGHGSGPEQAVLHRRRDARQKGNAEIRHFHRAVPENHDILGLDVPVDDAPAVGVAEAHIGKMLDNRYEILEVIGTGGMAVVFKAKCHRLNRMVAIKMLWLSSVPRRISSASSWSVTVPVRPSVHSSRQSPCSRETR